MGTHTQRTEWAPGPAMSVMEMKLVGTEENVVQSQDPTSSRRKDPFNGKIILQMLSLLNRFLLRV